MKANQLKINTPVQWYDNPGQTGIVICNTSRQSDKVVIVEWDSNHHVEAVNIDDLNFDKPYWPQNYSDQEVVEKINKVFENLKFEPSDAEHYTWGHKEDVPKALILCGKALEEIRSILSDQYEIG